MDDILDDILNKSSVDKNNYMVFNGGEWNAFSIRRYIEDTYKVSEDKSLEIFNIYFSQLDTHFNEEGK